MSVFRKIQNYVSVLLLFALFLLMYNNIANQHEHLLPNGQSIVHSHPFSKTDENNSEKNHSHNACEFFFISLINNLFSYILLISFVFRFLQTLSYRTAFYYKNEIYLKSARI